MRQLLTQWDMHNMQNLHNFSKDQIAENNIIFKERLEHYKKLGIDHIQLRKNIIDLIDCNPTTILEVGTGKGILTVHLAEICNSVISVDLDADEQQTALLNLLHHQCADKVTLVCEDASMLDYPDKHFDLVVSAISFHHFEKPRTMIDEMVRLTKKQLIITDFTEHGFDILEKSHQTENRHHVRMNHAFNSVPQWLNKNMD